MNQHNVLLICPRSSFLDSDKVFPPLGILYLKALLDQHNYPCSYTDDFDIQNLEKYDNITTYAISCTTPQFPEAVKILKGIKQKYPCKKVVIGGPHATYYTDVCVDAGFDHIIKGVDGEKGFLELLEGNNNKIIESQKLSVEEMNNLPRPFREKEFLTRYHYTLLDRDNKTPIMATTIMTSRGCPMGCRFCENARTGVRLYDSKRISEEIEDVLNMGFKAIMFFDDIFALSLNRVKEMTAILQKHDVKYRCFAHSHTFNEEMAKLLVNSGCVEIGFGAESGSDEILKNINKITNVENHKRLLNICHNFGIRTKAFLMLGLPGENFETIAQTEKFIAWGMESGKLSDFDLGIYYPYRNTQIHTDYFFGISPKDDIYISNTESIGVYKGKNGMAESIVGTKNLTPEDIRNEKDRIFNKYNKNYFHSISKTKEINL